MPVMKGVFVERSPLTTSEQQVAWVLLNSHVIRRRAALEGATLALAKRIGFLVGGGIAPTVQLRELEQKLAAGLLRTYRFGYEEAQAEIARLRRREAASETLSAVRKGDEADAEARRRFGRLAAEATLAVEAAAREAEGEVFASTAAAKQLHLSVMEVVGLSLNLGRTAGALSAPGGPPEFSLRSEQLDRGTCPRCSELHGQIVQVGSAGYYEILPPAHCYGGGRCRGVMVYADGVGELQPAGSG